ncbi:dipeptide ABC transporter ATP-binding protein [Alsobacter sp. SYSU M60028]|uniref:Dipeptide ABC transporter ATP-binding protein n=1 Tax=Alsobacter ponti TaxID=2962936 RepID=A0ABT1LH15_9HYPH|nr:dipeptide ABC transporter ATP-binding protein [Alsobacter ponti]MCP8940800.1 dipeptide ABC transporter ATP-binding protein [Alsobacter ponti]
MSTILEATDLTKHFRSGGGLFHKPTIVRAVDGVSFAVRTGETLAIVGESGCGKSTVGRLALRLLEATSGSVKFEGKDLASMDEDALRGLRREMQMVFQDPFSSLNPRMTLGDIVGEPLWLHGMGSARERRERTRELLSIVGLRPEHAQRYPHEFSGGQRQRIGIARALASNPRLVIGDEPVSALDVSIQAQVINLLEDLKDRFSLTLVIIAHDLAVIRHMSDRVIVMYLGKIVETAPTAALYAEPLHPYTRALLAAIPLPAPGLRAERKLLEGDIPSPANPPSGCRFHTRCPFAQARCREEEPALRDAGGREVACHFYETLPRADAERAVAIPESAAKRRRMALYREHRDRQESDAAAAAPAATAGRALEPSA